MLNSVSEISQQVPDGHWLPIVFVMLMGLSILIYVILDGFDLGVGILFATASEDDKDTMISSIGPFWDANETWLVLSVGLLLVAFPMAHGIILTALYLPVFIMLVGLILRGVAFDFRVKASFKHKTFWNLAFFAGSLMAAASQGYMLGLYIIGLEHTLAGVAFGLLTALCLIAGYAFIGSCWLIMKTEGALQVRAVKWARTTIGFVALGLASVSLVTPMVSPRIFDKWFSIPEIILLAPIPIVSVIVLFVLYQVLNRYPLSGDQLNWAPFTAAISLFVLGFFGMAYSFYPYVVPDKLTLWQASSAPESLMIILAGAGMVLPVILGYSVYAYWVFWGKTKPLSYGE